MKARIILSLIFSALFFSSYSQCFTCADAPDGTIFCDDFESTAPLTERYFNADNLLADSVGRDGSRGMLVKWTEGTTSVGGVQKSFGRTPDSYIGNHAATPTVDYREIYWRIDLRNQPGWVGGGGKKLSRATCLTDNWAQAMIAHIWSDGNYLAMDPATGIDNNGTLVSTKYNDFDNLIWLGKKQGTIDLFATENSGKWYCIEAHVKLNTSGNSDGIFEFWINDTLQAGTYNLNWVHDFDDYGINAIFLENYWNGGSPADQERYMDNFVISIKRIGCGNCGSTSTDATEIKDSNTVNVCPNPTSNYFNIQVGREIAMNGYELELFNSNGTAVYKTKEIKNLSYSYNLNGYSSGIYFYKLISNAQQIKTGKFIVKAN